MNRLLNKYPYPILLLALIFTLKALYLAFFVTPLWDIPDETGHFSYVRDLAEGRGLPLLGKAMIKADVMAHVSHNQNAKPVANWIAQHPPIYYLIAAVPLKIGMAATSEPELLFRLPRLVAAISGGLLLLVLFRTMRTLGLDNYRAAALAAAIGFIPMVSHLASGTNHDVTLFLFSALVVHFLARFLLHRQLSDAYWCAAWMTLAAGTKMTAWVVILPLLAVFTFEIKGHVKHRLRHICGITAAMAIIPAVWMTRNFIYFHDPMYTAATNKIDQSINKSLYNFIEYILSNSITERLTLHFYGLFGWVGTGRGKVVIMPIHGLPYSFFSLVLVASVLLVTFWSSLIIYRGMPGFSRVVSLNLPNQARREGGQSIFIKFFSPRVLLFVISAGTLIFFENYHSGDNLMISARILSAVLLVFIGLLGPCALRNTHETLDRLMLYSIVFFSFFSLVLLWTLYGIFLKDGWAHALHGRYLYPIVPFILVALGVAIQRLRIPGIVLIFFVTGLATMELEAFLLQVFPFYGGNVW
ncbi:MAG: glycosyltransferase family 39 protein [Desulfobulbus sp.]|nr:glycosyltransferase family 39 protein [Desulfobulbus sp.]